MANSNTNPNPGKKVDLPPKGNRNPDPITKEAGAHPIETGVGAAVGGAGAGFAAGMVAGPIGAAVGTVIGGVAGGLAGKGVGEMIDPTTENQWLGEYYNSLPADKRTRSQEDYRTAYRYGLTSRQQQNQPYDQVEDTLEEGWNSHDGSKELDWDEVQPAIKHAYSRDLSKMNKGKQR